MTRVTYISNTVVTHTEAVIEDIIAWDESVLVTTDLDISISGIGLPVRVLEWPMSPFLNVRHAVQVDIKIGARGVESRRLFVQGLKTRERSVLEQSFAVSHDDLRILNGDGCLVDSASCVGPCERCRVAAIHNRYYSVSMCINNYQRSAGDLVSNHEWQRICLRNCSKLFRPRSTRRPSAQLPRHHSLYRVL